MPENEFEKQVQRKMDEFRLRPSDPVWEKIREEMKEKKRRRLLILIPSLLAASLIFGWLGYRHFYSDNEPASLQKEAVINNPLNNDKTTPANTDQDITTTNRAGGHEELNNAEKNKTGSEGDAAEGIQNDIPHKVASLPGKKRRLETAIAGKGARTSQPHKQTSGDRSANAGQSRAVKDIPARDGLAEIPDVSDNRREENKDLTAEATARITKDNAPVSPVSELKAKADPGILQKNAPAITNLPVLKNALVKFSPKIRWGLSFSGGISSRTKEPFRFTSAEKAEAFNAVAPGFAGNVSGGILILPPSDVRPGPAFKAGAFADKPLSKRFSISAGLQYAYSSDHITIGNEVNSANGNTVVLDRNNNIANVQAQTAFSSSGSKNRNYTNKYHFIELPVTAHYTINKNWKNPFVWNAGASLGRIVSTNALLYDIAWGGVYYEGKNDIKKTQFTVSTGFSLRFAGSGRLRWEIGPQVAMNTSQLFSGSHDSNKHPVYGGLNLRLSFPGKK